MSASKIKMSEFNVAAYRASGPAYLMDSCINRRSAICRYLSEMGITVHIIDDNVNISKNIPKYGVIFAADNGDNVLSALKLSSTSKKYAPVVAYNEKLSSQRIVSTILSGAINYLVWPDDKNLFHTIIMTIGTQFNSGLDKKINEDYKYSTTKTYNNVDINTKALASLSTLTDREKNILQLVVNGLSSRDIGKHLNISNRTVDTHRANIMRKLGFRNSIEAVKFILENNLTDILTHDPL